MKLSVIIPVYNEEKTIGSIIQKVLNSPVVAEIIVVNDGSKDRTLNALKKIADKKIKIFSHKKNQGKGAAIITGITKASSEYVIIQDADLEYDPSEFILLLKNASNKTAVYGSRILGKNKHAYTRTYLGNILVTAFCNLLFGVKLTDSYTCYKLVPLKALRDINLSSKGFEIEAEITAKLIKKGLNIIEVPISYQPRTYNQGKKIKLKDAIKGVSTFLRIKYGN